MLISIRSDVTEDFADEALEADSPPTVPPSFFAKATRFFSSSDDMGARSAAGAEADSSHSLQLFLQVSCMYPTFESHSPDPAHWGQRS